MAEMQAKNVICVYGCDIAIRIFQYIRFALSGFC